MQIFSICFICNSIGCNHRKEKYLYCVISRIIIAFHPGYYPERTWTLVAKRLMTWLISCERRELRFEYTHCHGCNLPFLCASKDFCIVYRSYVSHILKWANYIISISWANIQLSISFTCYRANYTNIYHLVETWRRKDVSTTLQMEGKFPCTCRWFVAKL